MMTAIRYISDNNAHYLFFFFYGCADHRDLHSFPTRRSSDLVPMTNVWHHKPNIDRDVAAIFDPFGNAVHTALSDRKSTRLNSSHLGISYAVFCLKKKKAATGAKSRQKFKTPTPIIQVEDVPA